MSITVLVPTTLRAEAGDQRTLELPATATLGALRRYVNVYVNGTDCRELGGPTAPIPDGAEVQIIPSVAGG